MDVGGLCLPFGRFWLLHGLFLVVFGTLGGVRCVLRFDGGFVNRAFCTFCGNFVRFVVTLLSVYLRVIRTGDGLEARF